jgi:large subunit ribosomal protein L22
VEVSARAKHVGVSARKVRLVLEHLPGKRIDEALTLLRFLPVPSARVVAKVVKSAAANAENNYQLSPANLRIKAAYADEGRSTKRHRARARGRASPIVRRASHITVVVEEEAQSGP